MKIPILKLGVVLITSLQGDIEDESLIKFQAELLEACKDTRITGVVLDITALEIVDSYLARVINETARMISLLGKECVVTGMQPTVAITLLEMGREFIKVRTALDLEKGVSLLANLSKREKDMKLNELGIS